MVLISISLMSNDTDHLVIELVHPGVLEAGSGQSAHTWLRMSGPGVGAVRSWGVIF